MGVHWLDHRLEGRIEQPDIWKGRIRGLQGTLGILETCCLGHLIRALPLDDSAPTNFCISTLKMTFPRRVDLIGQHPSDGQFYKRWRGDAGQPEECPLNLSCQLILRLQWPDQSVCYYFCLSRIHLPFWCQCSLFIGEPSLHPFGVNGAPGPCRRPYTRSFESMFSLEHTGEKNMAFLRGLRRI